MNLLFWGLTISLLGKMMLAAGVLIANSELEHEQRIDQEVIQSFKVERVLTVTGIILMVSGYFMEIYFYGFTTQLLTCFGNKCNEVTAALILSQ
jgi:hypothetical protein